MTFFAPSGCINYFQSAMNINRKQLKSLLRDPVASLIDVENIKMYLLKGFSDVSKSIRMSSVISQKGESQQLLEKNKARQIFRKTDISYPLIRTPTCAYQG